MAKTAVGSGKPWPSPGSYKDPFKRLAMETMRAVVSGHATSLAKGLKGTKPWREQLSEPLVYLH